MSSKKKRKRELAPPTAPTLTEEGATTSGREVHHHALGSALEPGEGSAASAELEPDDEHDAKTE